MRDLPLGEVSEIFDEWAKEMKIPTRDIMFSMSRTVANEITIYTDRPGLMIGKAGCMIDKYKAKFNELIDKHNELIRQINMKPGREFTLSEMPYVSLNIIEVVRADFWLHYNSMSECF